LLSLPNTFLENPRATPRLGLLYLGTTLREAGHDVSIRHLQTLDELQSLISGNAFGFIGISATTREYPDAVQVLNYLKRMGCRATVAIGGPHATALPTECQRNGFDLVITGEADTAIVDLVAEPPASQRIVPCGAVANLDSLPIPDRSLLGEEAWRPFLGLGEDPGLRLASIMLSRGCPYRCAFCGSHLHYRRRSAGHIGRELLSLHSQGYDGLVILDDLPFVGEPHVRSFCDQVRPLGLRFRCNFRTDLLTPGSAQLLAKAGCSRLQFGIESASQIILDGVAKGTHYDSNGHAITICHEYGMQAKAMFIWGLPGDGPESADALVAWVTHHRPDSLQVSLFTPLPGSPLWQSGYHRQVVDYSALSFFTNGRRDLAAGLANDRLPASELHRLYEMILSECATYTHIDRGLSPDGTLQGIDMERSWSWPLTDYFHPVTVS
jgi:anaerobic magnesium-protoporphyrin IX monomethyl ester cyclase